MLKSPPMKSTFVLPHFCMKELEKLSGCTTFLSHDVVNVY